MEYRGYMVYTVVLIVISWNYLPIRWVNVFVRCNVEKQRSEATFRTNLVQHNKQAELIALSNAESLQRRGVERQFHAIKRTGGIV